MTAMNQIETHAPHTGDNNINPNALAIKVRKERSQMFITAVSSPSTTIITPPSIKPASLSSSATSKHSLCLNCNVEFSDESKFFSKELKNYFSDKNVNGTGFTTNARNIDGHYTQNRDTATFITNRSFVHAAEHELRLLSLRVVVEARKISSDSRTDSLLPITLIEIALSQISDAPPDHFHQDNDVNPPKAPTHPLAQSASNTYTKHAESQLNEGITPSPALSIKSCITSLFGIIALHCGIIDIYLFIKSSLIRTPRSFIERKVFLLVLIALRFRPSSALSITTFRAHTCALQNTSTTSPGFNAFKCFGSNDYGQLGNEHTADIGDGPNEMGAFLPNIDTNCSIDDIKQVETGADHTCILTDTGKVKCFGRNNYGQLGYGNTASKGNAPNTMGIHLPFIDFGGSWFGTQIAAG
eukprot:15322_1